MKQRFLIATLLAVFATALAASGAPARSAASPSNTTAPAVTGTAKVGQMVTVSNGTWTGSPTSYAYQWQRCTSSTSCADVTSATSQSYKIVAADAGRTLRAVVTASNADGKSTANSNETVVVAASGGPQNTVRPTVTGNAIVGATLTATTGSWTGTPTSYAYRWLQCDGTGAYCIPIFGATGKTYGVQLSDVYSTLRVRVTATNAEGSTAARSDATDLVQPVQPVVTPGNKAPTVQFRSLRRVGLRVYARFTVCDDAPKRVTVIERDAKRATLAYVRKFAVVPNPCTTANRSWIPAARFRTKGTFVVTLRAVDKSGASSRFVSRTLTRH
jgi:hypothetical protein